MITRAIYDSPIGVCDFYNPRDYLWLWWGSLPHWEQAGKLYFVTFRLNDALPSTVLNRLKQMKEDFLRSHPQPWDFDTGCFYFKHISDTIDKYIDSGYGSCVLRSDEVRQILIDTLLENDGKDYNLYDYVIMPNHIHLLIKPSPELTLKEVMSGIKRKSAFRINSKMNVKGSLWQREYYDRLIRNYDELQTICQYINDNPKNLDYADFHLHTSLVN